VIFEIQQNSDTTYRVFDWNRVGLDGKPRELHVAQSLASIDFADFEPGLVASPVNHVGPAEFRHLVKDPLFSVDLWRIQSSGSILLGHSQIDMRIIGVWRGGSSSPMERKPWN